MKKEKQTLFVDYEELNEETIKRLIDVLKAGQLGTDIARIEEAFRDVNVYAIVGYALNYGFYNTPRDLEGSERVLARGVSRDLTSSYFVSGAIKIERGERDEGMRLVELAAQRGYPPALFMLGMNHVNMKWRHADKMFGYDCLHKASLYSYLPAKQFIYYKQSQTPYSANLRIKSIISLFNSVCATQFIELFFPFSKLISFFREI